MRTYIIILQSGEELEVIASSYFDAKFRAVIEFQIKITDIASVL